MNFACQLYFVKVVTKPVKYSKDSSKKYKNQKPGAAGPKVLQSTQPLTWDKPTNHNDLKTMRKSILDSLISEDGSKPYGGNGKSFDNDNDDDYYNDDDEDDDNDDDEDDEGKIIPLNGTDPDQLLNSLINGKKIDEISFASHSPSTPLTRKLLPIDGMSSMEKSRLPSAPRDVQIQIVKPRFVTLNWMEPLKNPDEVTSYTVYYKMSTSERYDYENF